MKTSLLQTKLYIPQTRADPSTGLPTPSGRGLRRTSLVPRPRLIERLNEGLRHKLTLVSAPAGFGKTTLLSEWVYQLAGEHPYGYRQESRGAQEKLTPAPLNAAWLSLDEGDNDPVRFLAYFVAALQTIAANIGEGLMGLLHASRPQPPPLESILTALINEVVEIPDHFALVLDDYHLIEAQTIDQALIFLLDHLPPQMHLVIASRTDPSLPLSRWRARDQMAELREKDLRFTLDEVAMFLEEVMGLNISAENVATLESRTEGWIAGLQLAALALQSLGLSQSEGLPQSHHWQGGDPERITDFINNFSGSNRYIIDYLADEVLQQRPKGTKDFLLQTSILDRLSAPLCDAILSRGAEGQGGRGEREKSPLLPYSLAPLHLTPSASSQDILESLEAANLFIVPLDDERRWYRYHHLFADLLRQRLRREQPERIPTLHRRASEWYEQRAWPAGQSLGKDRFLEEAVKHALAAEDFERAAHLIEKLAEVLWERGEPTSLLGWLEALPDEQVSARPSLCNFHAWVLFLNGQNLAAELRLQAAERGLDAAAGGLVEASPDDPNQLNELDKPEQQGRAAAIRASIAFRQGDGPRIFQFSHQALESLSEKSLMWRCLTAMALGYAQDFSGDTAAAFRTLSGAVAMSKASGNIYLILSTSLHLGTILMQQGRLKQVYRLCQELLQLAEERQVLHTEMAGCLYDELGLVLCEWDDLDGALRHLKKGSELSQRGYDVGVLGWSHLTMLRALFTQGDVAGAEAIVQTMDRLEREFDVPPWYTSPKEAWRARLWLRQGDLEAASQWVQDRGLNVGGELTYLREDEYRVLARILVAQERLEKALELLERLLKAAEAGGRIASVIEILMIQALAHAARGEDEAALSALARALCLAEPGGYIRAFVDEGEPMAKLLRQAACRGIAVDYVGKILAAFFAAVQRSGGARAKESPPASRHLRSPALVEPLSERELEVLGLIAEGLTNQEVATRLFLTLNTVKAHAHHIFGKLNANNRTQAVARARGLGLLPPV